MATKHLCESIVHLPGDFCAEDAAGYHEALKDGEDQDIMDELIDLCEECFECKVLDARMNRFGDRDSQTNRQDDDQYIIIYLFGPSREISIESPIQDLDEKGARYTLSSGDLLYLPAPSRPRVYSITESSTKEILETIIITLVTAKPYSGAPPVEKNVWNFPSQGNFSRGISIPPNIFSHTPTPGILSSYTDGNSTHQTVDADSEYGKRLMKHISASLKAQGINFDWDD